MVKWQLFTLDHLNICGFGCPPPRHGLQLLYWFANHCLTFDPGDFEDVMKLASDCQPENSVYGFHHFGNTEEILPVLCKHKNKKSRRQLVYYVVGNLNTKTYPKSAELPKFVRENYEMDSSANIDRIIISYQVQNRKVEKVYITEHDDERYGRFQYDRTHEILPELIQALQNPQQELSTFLTQMGYYGDVETQNSDPSDQLILSVMQNDPFESFSEAFSQHVDLNFDPFSYNQQGLHQFSSTGPDHRKVQKKNKKAKTNKRLTIMRQSSWDPRWYQPEDFNKEEEKRTEGRFSWSKLLFGLGAFYLAAKCFRWLMRSCWYQNLHQNHNLFKTIHPRTPRCAAPHVMLDYIY
nr:uncharacterized protein LOC107394415 [Nothobranchius furzeri]